MAHHACCEDCIHTQKVIFQSFRQGPIYLYILIHFCSVKKNKGFQVAWMNVKLKISWTGSWGLIRNWFLFQRRESESNMSKNTIKILMNSSKQWKCFFFHCSIVSRSRSYLILALIIFIWAFIQIWPTIWCVTGKSDLVCVCVSVCVCVWTN